MAIKIPKMGFKRGKGLLENHCMATITGRVSRIKQGEIMGNSKTRITREQYKRFKRMDHKQMEDFITNLYNEGYADGKAAAEPKIKPSDIASALIEVKGVGTKKAAEIMAAVNKLYERGAQ